MRRSDREVKDINEIKKIIDGCDCCHLGLIDGNMPYVVPMNFGYELKGSKLALYFHSAHEGKKLDLIKQNSNACFAMDGSHKLITGDAPCAFSMEYESVMGSGKITVLNNIDEKIAALKILMKQYSSGVEYTFEARHSNSVTIFKLDVEEFTAKRFKR